MKQKLAAGIVRFRLPLLITLLVLTVLCTFFISRTRINYDLTRYLSEDSMTRRALKVMEEEFSSTEQLRVMFTDPDQETLDGYIAAMTGLEEVHWAAYDPAEDTRSVDGHTYHLVTLTLHECDAGALVLHLRSMFPEGSCIIGGSSAALLDLQELVAREIPRVMAIAVAIVLLVLLLTSHAWLEPAVLLITLGISIVINMGTNFIFPDVSFITFAVCAILQLALSIDYAIMLLHAWNRGCDSGLSAQEAMKDALEECFMRITSSALTTAAGLLSLLFMSFTIGFDIGLVLSKGILISMLGVFLFLPALTLLAGKLLRATRHRPLQLGGGHLAHAVDTVKKPLALFLILAVCCGAWLNYRIPYSFSEAPGQSETESDRIDALFGASNPLVLLVPGGAEDGDVEKQRELVHALEELRLADGRSAVREITALVTTGQAALEYYTAQDVADLTGKSLAAVRIFFAMNGFGDSVRADRLLDAAGSLAEGNDEITALQEALSSARELFLGPHYSRMLLEPGFLPSDPGFKETMSRLLGTVGSFYGEDYFITGTAMSNYDIGNAFTGDLLRVNGITFLAILMIVALSFRAMVLPLLLVFVIEGAIWITMGISTLIGEPVFFMAYLICLAIQMGATIDYGILLCDQYRAARLAGLEKRQAMETAMKGALPTVLTSGAILTTAGGVIGIRCSVYYISSIGLLLSRGTLVSVILVLTLLPALLLLLDGIIFRSGSGRKGKNPASV